MKIAVLAGGVGGAKFLLGLKAFLGWKPFGPKPQGTADEVTAIVNTGDDIRLHNLHISPDLDSCMYTTAGAADPDRGWGRVDESWAVASELALYGAEAPWFSLGDKDIATHLVRTRMLDAGYSLSAVTEALTDRWQPGVRLLPMSDDRVETHVVITDPDTGGGSGADGGDGPAAAEATVGGTSMRNGDEPAADAAPAADATRAARPSLIAVHFQEWWIRYRAAIPAVSIMPIGAEEARPAPGVLDAIGGADVIFLAPSNPVVSIGPILAVPGIAESLRSAPAPILGISPIIAGSPVRGHADACLEAIGVECSAQGVAGHYGARSAGGLLDAFLVAEGDRAAVPGMAIGHAPLLMTDPQASAAMVSAALVIAGVRR